MCSKYKCPLQTSACGLTLDRPMLYLKYGNIPVLMVMPSIKRALKTGDKGFVYLVCHTV